MKTVGTTLKKKGAERVEALCFEIQEAAPTMALTILSWSLLQSAASGKPGKHPLLHFPAVSLCCGGESRGPNGPRSVIPDSLRHQVAAGDMRELITWKDVF